jgi:hypothetical protein
MDPPCLFILALSLFMFHIVLGFKVCSGSTGAPLDFRSSRFSTCARRILTSVTYVSLERRGWSQRIERKDGIKAATAGKELGIRTYRWSTSEEDPTHAEGGVQTGAKVLPGPKRVFRVRTVLSD